MNGHNSALEMISAIEKAAVLLSVLIWILILLIAVFSKRLENLRILCEILSVFGALAITIAVFIPFLFIDLFAGRGGEAMLGTLPITLVGAPLWFCLMLYLLRKLWRTSLGPR